MIMTKMSSLTNKFDVIRKVSFSGLWGWGGSGPLVLNLGRYALRRGKKRGS